MKPTSTQSNIKIAGIKDGIVFLDDGGYRFILSCSTINFALKSEQEQNSLVFQYQSFLNSLHFPIQIVMQSKKLDLTPYLKKVSDLKDKQTNELIKMQAIDYIDFVGNLINVANIMKKNFYVVIPYQPVSLSKGTVFEKIFKKPAAGPVRVNEEELKRHKEELTQRANTIALGLGGMGIQCVQLNTEEIIELFYKVYNPEIAGKERVENADQLTSSFIADANEKKGLGAEQKPVEEAVIDNTAIVQQKQKQDSQIAHRQDLKAGQTDNSNGQATNNNPPADGSAQNTQTPASDANITNQQPQAQEPNSQAGNGFGS
ncbi:MAG: TraC family protein [Patescibacteria group bacterium]|nr:TraC family protein [Patescibacteria group bacterium]